MNSNSKLDPPSSDSATFFPDCEAQMAPTTILNMNQNRTMDEHQVVDQVQLQFIPTGNENLFATGQIHHLNEQNQTYMNEPLAIVTGAMEQERSRDTNFLVSDDIHSIDLGLPVQYPSGSSGPSSKFTIWQFDYYARYFDLTTNQFFQRILGSLFPLTDGGKGTYIHHYIHSNPDLYGPFWIPLTLAFTISICDDIIRYMNLNYRPYNYGRQSNLSVDVILSLPHPYSSIAFGFDQINLAIMITFSYVIFAPLILWSFCQWRRCSKLYTFIECFCAYGYSLSLFVPITIMALVNVPEIQFILFVSAAFLSGSVLLMSFAPVVHSDPSRSFKFAYVMLIFVLISHLVLALLYLYYFL